MQTNLSKWGNSLGLRIPSDVVKALNLKSGSEIELTLEGNKIILKPKRTVDIEEMISRITPENRHESYFDIKPVGNEEW